MLGKLAAHAFCSELKRANAGIRAAIAEFDCKYTDASFVLRAMRWALVRLGR